jgi:hypothetical protein
MIVDRFEPVNLSEEELLRPGGRGFALSAGPQTPFVVREALVGRDEGREAGDREVGEGGFGDARASAGGKEG